MIGPFVISVQSRISSFSQHLKLLYSNSHIPNSDELVDYHISLQRPSGLRSYICPQVVFELDGYQPFKPLPLTQAPGMFEWGLNWCIANSAHQYLIIHSAIIEKDGVGLILPGSPGSGKSTLCSALIHKGWRLLSDEMALYSRTEGLIYPSPRPVSLKNQSIKIIREVAPSATFGECVKNTAKGDITHMRAPKNSTLRESEAVRPKYLVFPRFMSQGAQGLQPLSKGMAAMKIINNSFNFNVLGSAGFIAVTELIDKVSCYEMSYSSLDESLALIEEIVANDR